MPTNVGDTNFFIYLVKFALSSTLLNLHWLISWSQSVYQEIWKIQIYKSGNSCSSTEIHQSIYKACWVRNRIWQTVELTSKEQQQQLKVSVPPEPDGGEQQNHMECHQGHQPWLLKQSHIQSATQRTMFVSFEREREKRERDFGDPDAISYWGIREWYRPVDGADEGAQVVGGGAHAPAELGGERLHETRQLVQVRRHGGLNLLHRATRAAELGLKRRVRERKLGKRRVICGYSPHEFVFCTLLAYPSDLNLILTFERLSLCIQDVFLSECQVFNMN